MLPPSSGWTSETLSYLNTDCVTTQRNPIWIFTTVKTSYLATKIFEWLSNYHVYCIVSVLLKLSHRDVIFADGHKQEWILFLLLVVSKSVWTTPGSLLNRRTSSLLSLYNASSHCWITYTTNWNSAVPIIGKRLCDWTHCKFHPLLGPHFKPSDFLRYIRVESLQRNAMKLKYLARLDLLDRKSLLIIVILEDMTFICETWLHTKSRSCSFIPVFVLCEVVQSCSTKYTYFAFLNVKLSLCFNWAPCHEGVLESGVIAPLILWPWH